MPLHLKGGKVESTVMGELAESLRLASSLKEFER